MRHEKNSKNSRVTTNIYKIFSELLMRLRAIFINLLHEDL